METVFKSVEGNLFCSQKMYITGYYFNNNPTYTKYIPHSTGNIYRGPCKSCLLG